MKDILQKLSLGDVTEKYLKFINKNKLNQKFSFYIYLSLFFHLFTIFPVLFEFFYSKSELDSKIYEQVVYLNFEDKKYYHHGNNKNISKATSESITKNKALKASKTNKGNAKKLAETKKMYEDRMSQKVSVVLNSEIEDEDEITGNYIIEFTVNKNGEVKSRSLLQETDNALFNKRLLEILNKIRKFEAIPSNFPLAPEYKFAIPIEIAE